MQNTSTETRQVKAILFDCDGTLAASEDGHYSSWKHALQKHGKELALEEYYNYVGIPTTLIASLFAKELKKDCAKEITLDKNAHFHRLLHAGIPPIEHTVAFLHRLAKEKTRYNLKLGLASAASKMEILQHLKHLGIEEYFDLVLSGQDDLGEYRDPEGVNKPKPYIYLHSAKMLGLHPSECVVIEDSSSGVAAGINAGCFTIAVPNPFSCRQDFSKASLKIESFERFTIEQFLKMASK